MTVWRRLVREAKLAIVTHALACTKGNVNRAARLLGMEPANFRKTRARLR